MINQNELIYGTLKFIDRYNRLPFLSEDDIDIEVKTDNGELELRPYRALKYVKEFFTNQDKYSQYLLDNNLLTYDKIAETINVDKNRLVILINKEIDSPETHERRMIELFFNKDYYTELGLYNDVCNSCTKRCKQTYWTMMVNCNKYNKSNTKTKNKNT